MKYLRYAVMFALLALPLAYSQAQVRVGVGIGVGGYVAGPPACTYGYYPDYPYACAPYGYWGPSYFANGVFIGAGPWFHGPRGFYGHVDNRYDPRNGYHGPLPEHGAKPFTHFQGNEARDGQGHTGTAAHAPTNEHSAGFAGNRGASRSGGHPR